MTSSDKTPHLSKSIYANDNNSSTNGLGASSYSSYSSSSNTTTAAASASASTSSHSSIAIDFSQRPVPSTFHSIAPETLVGSSPSAEIDSSTPMARVNRFDTSLNMRVDIEASMAYWLGLFSGAFLLIVERKNDYVRYHAWQSSLFSVFTILLSTFFALLSWTALETIVTVVSIVGLMVCAFKAYKQGGTLDRFKLPVIGQVADRWVEEE